MKRLVLCVTLLALAACRSERTEAPPAPAPAASESESEAKAPQPPAKKEEAPLPDVVKLVREAEAAFQAGALDEAIEKSKAALALAPQHAVANNILGRAAAARFATSGNAEDADTARRAFQAAVQANPGFWPALQNLGELYEKEGRPVEAARYFKQVLQLEPNHPEKARYEALVAKAGKKG